MVNILFLKFKQSVGEIQAGERGHKKTTRRQLVGPFGYSQVYNYPDLYASRQDKF